MASPRRGHIPRALTLREVESCILDIYKVFADTIGGRSGLAGGSIPLADSNGDLIDSGFTDDGTTISTTRNLVASSFLEAVDTYTANQTLTESNGLVICKTNSFTISLPAVASVATGKRYHIKNAKTNTYNVTVTANGAETIDTVTSWTLPPGANMLIANDGTEWHIL